MKKFSIFPALTIPGVTFALIILLGFIFPIFWYILMGFVGVLAIATIYILFIVYRGKE